MENCPVFRTPMPPLAYDFAINYRQKHSFFGSCFAQNIGKLLLEQKFDLNLNPFGILYNPVSIASTLQALLNEKKYTSEDLFLHNELWHSFAHHGSFSGTDKNRVTKQINEAIEKGRKNLLQSDNLFITFGTARAYFLKSNGKIVANCHKLPAACFDRKYLSVEEITQNFRDLIEALKRHNPKLRIIFTISPVRHLRDGMQENFLSKSILRLSIESIMQICPETFYFPAYEIMMDDLRDYRFYAKDMLHPGEQAVEYIMSYFKVAFFDPETQNIYKKMEQWNKANQHRLLHQDTQAAELFHENLEQQKNKIKKDYPFLADRI